MMRPIACRNILPSLALLLASGCGLTEASNPRNDKKTPPKPAPGSIYVVELSTYDLAPSADVAISMRRADAPADGPVVATFVAAAPSLIKVDGVEPGVYNLAIAAKQGTAFSRHNELVVVDADMTTDEKQILQARCDEIEAARALPKHAVFSAAPVTGRKPNGPLRLISVYESAGAGCTNADQPAAIGTLRPDDTYPVVEVVVQEAGADLFLASEKSVTWRIKCKDGGSVGSVTLSGGSPATLVGDVPPTMNVAARFGTDPSTTRYVENRGETFPVVPGVTNGASQCGATPLAQTDLRSELLNARSLSGASEIVSVQAAYRRARFHVTAQTRGVLASEKKDSAFCYRKADGTIERFVASPELKASIQTDAIPDLTSPEVVGAGAGTPGAESVPPESDLYFPELYVTVFIFEIPNPYFANAPVKLPRDQILSTSDAEKTALLANGWHIVGRFRLLRNAVPRTDPVYRCVATAGVDDHHFTTKSAACDGFTNEALLGYAFETSAPNFTAAYHGCEVQNVLPHAVRLARFNEPCPVIPEGVTVVDTFTLGYVWLLPPN